MHRDEKEDSDGNKMMGSSSRQEQRRMAASTSLATVCAPAFLFPVLLLLFVVSCVHGKRGEVVKERTERVKSRR